MRKVLYLINSLKNGGPVNMLYSLCKYLDNTQYKIYVMALKKCDINARDFSNLNCELIIINENNKLKRINKAFEEIKRISPDIIHSHGGLADWINVHTKNGSKKITTIHCDPDIDLIMKYGKVKGTIVANIFLHNLKRMDCPIACSETISNKIYENRKVKFDYIRNGIDPTMLVVNKSIKRSELKIEESDTVYAFCGYLSKRKNVKFLIEVFNTLPNNYKLLVIGDGDELVALKTSAKKDNVIFVGKVSTPANYLQLSDYFISASLSSRMAHTSSNRIDRMYKETSIIKNMLNSNFLTKKQVEFISKQYKVYCKRIDLLSRRSVTGIVKMVSVLNYYSRKRLWLTDLYYVLK